MFRFRKLLSLTTALLLLCALLTGCGQKKDVTELKSGTGTASISDVAVTDGQLTAAITVSDLSFAFLNDEACSDLAVWKVFRPYLEFSDGSTVRLATSGGGIAVYRGRRRQSHRGDDHPQRRRLYSAKTGRWSLPAAEDLYRLF